jgi:sec-independent protein translocase protein TatC
MPIIAFFFGKLRIITYKMLLKWARYAVLVIFIVAAVLTPGPDVASQLLLAGPLLGMYGLSILVVALTSRAEKSPATHVDKTE